MFALGLIFTRRSHHYSFQLSRLRELERQKVDLEKFDDQVTHFSAKNIGAKKGNLIVEFFQIHFLAQISLPGS